MLPGLRLLGRAGRLRGADWWLPLVLSTLAPLVACSYDFDAFVDDGSRPDTSTGGSSSDDGGLVGGAAGAEQDDGPLTGTPSSTAAAAGGSSSSESNTNAGGDNGTTGSEAPRATSTSGSGGSETTTSSTGASQGTGDSSTTTTGGATSGLDCDSVGGMVHGEHCYFVIAEGTGLGWEAARDACRAHSPDTHLVTITSDDEQTWLEATFFPGSKDLWIGLALEDTGSDPSSTCRLLPDLCPFSWVTDEALDYTHWAVHSESDVEPNYTGACVRLQLDDQNWADLDCKTTLSAICEDGE